MTFKEKIRYFLVRRLVPAYFLFIITWVSWVLSLIDGDYLAFVVSLVIFIASFFYILIDVGLRLPD